MKTFLEKLLEYYEIDEKTFLEYKKDVSFDDLPPYTNFKGINDVVTYLKTAIKEDKKILIYGDYDCDGIMSTSIVFNTLYKEGYKAGFYIPNRENDGYGLTINNIDLFHKLGYNIIICVDNGITLNEQIKYLNSLGMECVIMDHHTPGSVLPEAKYILHPKVSEFGDINMSAGEVTFYFSRAFLGYDDEYLLTLGMISTISDLMELRGYNRTLVRLGLKYLNQNRYNNILFLIGDVSVITEDSISMLVAPKVNAIGRLVMDNTLFNIVRYFTTDTDKDFIKRAQWIEQVNSSRKEQTNIATLNLPEINKEDAAIVENLDVPEGLLGLIANRLLNEYNKPTYILTNEGKDYLKGSARSKNGFNINRAFEILNSEDLLISSGGHALAGGFVLKKDNFATFKAKINELAKEYTFTDEEKTTILININDVSLENYDTLRFFAPFGQGNPKPVFVIDNFQTNQLKFSRDGKHIITPLSMNSSLISFNYNKDDIASNSVSFSGFLEVNYFRNNRSCQFKAIKIAKN